jgi:hypothetical protein
MALVYNTSGSSNVAVGVNTLRSNTTGSWNVSIGKDVLYANTTGNENTAIGSSVLKSNTTGSGNIGLGTWVLSSNTTGFGNIGLGGYALRNQTTGSFNFAFGTWAMEKNTTGTYNLANGYQSLTLNTVGNYNTATGHSSLYASKGSENVAYGYGAGSELTSGSSNVFLGVYSGTGATAVSNKLYIEASRTTNPLIGGDFSSAGRYVTINNKLGIGLNIGNVPLSRLVINGPNSPTSMGSAAYLATFYTDLPTEGMQAINAHVNPGSSTSLTQAGFFDSSTTGAIGGKSVGLKGRSYANVIGTTGRTYGLWGMAGNAKPGWNYGVYGEVIGSNAGAGIFGTATAGADGLDTTAYRSGMLAAFFHGDTFTAGQIYSTSGTVLTSDRRLKKNIKPLQNSLEKILKLEGVNFDWKQDTKMKFEKERQMGLIAQNVEKQFPLAVKTTTNSSGEVKFVSYTLLIAPIIESIKTLYAKILALITSDEKQNLEIKELKMENEKLKLEMKKQQESFDLKMKKLEAQSAKKLSK